MKKIKEGGKKNVNCILPRTEIFPFQLEKREVLLCDDGPGFSAESAGEKKTLADFLI